MARPCPSTLDLLAWEPEDPVRRFDGDRVRAATIDGLFARAVSELLREAAISGRCREEIADVLSAWRGRPIAKATLDGYASEAREDHSVGAAVLQGLMEVTGDVRPLQMMAERLGFAVVPAHHVHWIALGQISDVQRELNRKAAAARRAAKRGQP